MQSGVLLYCKVGLNIRYSTYTSDTQHTHESQSMSNISNLTKYKKAVRAANKYVAFAETDRYMNPRGYKAAMKHEQKFEELSDKAEAILEELTPEEEKQAIDWLAEHSLYGYHEEVC